MGIASIHSWQFLGYLGASPLHISKIVIAEMFSFCRRAPLFWTFLWGLVGVGLGWVGIMLETVGIICHWLLMYMLIYETIF